MVENGGESRWNLQILMLTCLFWCVVQALHEDAIFNRCLFNVADVFFIGECTVYFFQVLCRPWHIEPLQVKYICKSIHFNYKEKNNGLKL